MKLFSIFAAAVLGLTLSATPASALVSLPRPTPPPGPSPSGYVYQYVEATYRTISERTWVPDRIDWVTEYVWINGRYEQVYRQIVRPGHYETTTRRVLVSPGYWVLVRVETYPPYPRPVPLPRPVPVIVNPGTVGVDGYRSGPGEDLSKFSPLKDWPTK